MRLYDLTGNHNLHHIWQLCGCFAAKCALSSSNSLLIQNASGQELHWPSTIAVSVSPSYNDATPYFLVSARPGVRCRRGSLFSLYITNPTGGQTSKDEQRHLAWDIWTYTPSRLLGIVVCCGLSLYINFALSREWGYFWICVCVFLNWSDMWNMRDVRASTFISAAIHTMHSERPQRIKGVDCVDDVYMSQCLSTHIRTWLLCVCSSSPDRTTTTWTRLLAHKQCPYPDVLGCAPTNWKSVNGGYIFNKVP